MKKITIDGLEYRFDFDKAVSTGVLKPARKLGQKYEHKFGSIYVLSQTCFRNRESGFLSHFLSLINVETGVAYGEGKSFVYRKNDPISEEEFNSVTEGFAEEFTPIE